MILALPLTLGRRRKELLKIIGSLIILFSALFIAKSLTREIEDTLKKISAVRSVLEYTKRQIGCYALSASEILRGIDSKTFAECGYKKETPPRDFSEFFSSVEIGDGEIESALASFSKDFGKAYRADELAFCTLHIERVRAREQKLMKDFAKRKKVIYTVALCLALGAVVLLI